MYANIDVGASPKEWEILLNALKRVIVQRQMLSGSVLPDLYLSGIQYKRERGESWQTPNATFKKRAGDCEDLALYRACELCKSGINASVRIYRTGGGSYHAIVEINPGIFEDPSRILGMNKFSPFMSGESDEPGMLPGMIPGMLPGMLPGLIPGGQFGLIAAQYATPFASRAFKKWLRKRKAKKAKR